MIGLVLGIPLASAHVGDIVAGVDVFVAPTDAPVSMEATFGVLIGQDDGSFHWSCHEAVTANESVFLPQYDLSSRGEWLAAIRLPDEGRDGRSLFHSPDGCAWNAVAGLDDIVVNYVRFDPDDDDRAFAVSTTGTGGAVHVSLDGGRTWDVDLEPIADRRLQGVMIVDGEVFATGSDVDGTATFAWHRDAEGVWTSVALPTIPGIEGARLRVLDLTETTVTMVVDPLGSDFVITADRALTTFETVIEGEGEVLDASRGPDGLWLPMDFGSRALLLADDGTYTEVEPPDSVGVSTDRNGDLLLAGLAYLDGPLLITRKSDGTYEPTLYPDDILQPLDCPAGTETADICAPLWDQLEPRLRGFDDPPDTGGEIVAPPDDDDAEGCGCSAVEPFTASLALPLLAMVGLRRRR